MSKLKQKKNSKAKKVDVGRERGELGEKGW